MIESLSKLIEANKQLILTGAPGTGKTFLALDLAASLLGCRSVEELKKEEYKERFGFVQFHPAYDYTDFVEGLKPVNSSNGQIGFELSDGIFRKFCKEAGKEGNKDQKFVFVIDEINRADLSRVFGELFYALEPSYRGEKGKVKTQYSSLRAGSDSDFYVPENVFIIGTMNDIDRSVMSMDFALRRRFAWYEVKADDKRFEVVMDGVLADKSTLKEEAQKRYKKLNEAIGGEKALGEAYQIGPAYFRRLTDYQAEAHIWQIFWERHLELLIREYVRGMPDEKKLVEKFKNAYWLKPEPAAPT